MKRIIDVALIAAMYTCVKANTDNDGGGNAEVAPTNAPSTAESDSKTDTEPAKPEVYLD